MKRSFCLGSFAAILLSGCSKSSEMTEEEKASKIAFEALKANDFSRYQKLIPDKSDIEWYLGELKRTEKTTEANALRDLLKSRGGTAGFIEHNVEWNRKNFAAARERAAKELSWDQAEFVDTLEISPNMSRGLPHADIRFRAKAGGSTYVFQLDDCAKFQRGWLGGSGLSYQGEE